MGRREDRLLRKLEKDPAQPEYIFTEVGVGYRMAEDEEDTEN